MQRNLVACTLGLFGLGTAAMAHDMFLVVPDHDVPAASPISISLYNGTFEKSENTIDRQRMADVSVVDGAGNLRHPGPEYWRDDGATSILSVDAGPTGTLMVGVSTKPRAFELTAEEFNRYLEHDGILDTLAARGKDGTYDQGARERYSKHVKTLLRVAGKSSDTWTKRLGYPLEIVPLADPAALSSGDILEVLVLTDGEPLAGQRIYGSYAGHRAHTGEGAHQDPVHTRTDAAGIARIELSHPGRWFLRLIHMVPATEEDLDYISNWATLTFEIR